MESVRARRALLAESFLTSDADVRSTVFPADSQNMTVGDFFPAGQSAMVVFCPHPERIKDTRNAVQESWRVQSQAELAAVKTELELTKNDLSATSNEFSATKIRLNLALGEPLTNKSRDQANQGLFKGLYI